MSPKPFDSRPFDWGSAIAWAAIIAGSALLLWVIFQIGAMAA